VTRPSGHKSKTSYSVISALKSVFLKYAIPKIVVLVSEMKKKSPANNNSITLLVVLGVIALQNG